MIKIVSKDWEINNIETILFDKDGTFVDLHLQWGKITELRANEIINFFNLKHSLFKDLCLFLGYDVVTKRMLSNGITAIYSRSVIIEKLILKLQELGIKTTKVEIETIFDIISNHVNENIYNFLYPIESAINFIKKVRNYGIKTGIVTADSVKTTQLTIDYFQWNTLFDVIIGRESSNFTKETGIPCQIALKKLNAINQSTLIIGDTFIDYLSAKKAEIDNVILVATGQTSIEELKSLTSYSIKTLDDIMCIQNTCYY